MIQAAAAYLLSFSVPRNALLQMISAAILFGGWVVQPFLALYLVQGLGFSAQSSGIVLAALAAGTVAGSFSSGFLSARIGVKPLTILSLLATAGLCLVLPEITRRVTETVSRPETAVSAVLALFGMTSAFFRPLFAVQLARVCRPEDRSSAYAFYVATINVTATLGLIATGLLFDRRPDVIFYIQGGTAGLAALAVALLWEGVPQEKPSTGGDGSDEVFLLVPLAFTISALFLLETVSSQINATVPLYIVDRLGHSVADWGRIASLGNIMFALLIFPVTSLIKTVPLNWSAAFGAALTGVGFVAFLFGETLPEIYVLFTVIILGKLVFFPAIMALAQETAGSKRDQAMGAYYGIQSVAGILAPAAGLWFFEVGGPAALWLTCAAIALSAGIILILSSAWRRT